MPLNRSSGPSIIAGQSAGALSRYLEIVLAVTILLTALKVVHVIGGIVQPGWFNLFRLLFHFQFGLFGGAVLAMLLYLLPRSRLPRFGRILVLAAFYFWFVWLIVWVLVRRFFGIELSLDTVVELFTNRSAIAAVGLGDLEFVVIVGICLAIIAALAVLTDSVGRHCGNTLLRSGCLFFAAFFVLVHLPIRAYLLYHRQRHNPVALAYFDCVPSPLRSEESVSGLRGDRITLPNFESKARTAAYFDEARMRRMPPIRRPRNIVWINLESFRFDATDERAMPRLNGYRDQFQIKLNRQHWSGGNATQFGIFSMLSGLSGYQLQNLRRAGMHDPFLTLLASNGYRLRVGKKHQIHYASLAVLLPPNTIEQEIETGSPDEEDRRMVDRYLEDRQKRRIHVPTFDFLAFDATHWPYSFPKEHSIFQPAPPMTTSQLVLGSKKDLSLVRNRYGNACHFADEQIGRILDDLRQRGDLDSTIVVVVGDHGEEFEERGQMTHAAVLNDYQARTPLWMRIPDLGSEPVPIEVPTTHMDIVPTILEALGFSEDVLYTQGRSLISKLEHRGMISLCEQGFSVPLYRALVTETYISRWAHRPLQYLFSGVQRRDGATVDGEAWLREVRELYPETTEMYEVVPDVSRPPRKFTSGTGFVPADASR